MTSLSSLSSDAEHNARGAMIVVEGLDRAGKSSQCEMLQASLEKMGKSVQYIKFPDRTTPTGILIDQYLRSKITLPDHTIHLLFSSNRWELASKIQSLIANGTTLIIDRYSYSGAVYSAAKAVPNLTLDWAWQPEIGLPRPDLCLFLKIAPAEQARRGGFGEEVYETNAMQGRVRALFEKLLGMRHNEEILVIDAGKERDEVAKEILEPVLEVIGNVGSIGPLRKLGPWCFVPGGEGADLKASEDDS